MGRWGGYKLCHHLFVVLGSIQQEEHSNQRSCLLPSMMHGAAESTPLALTPDGRGISFLFASAAPAARRVYHFLSVMKIVVCVWMYSVLICGSC